MAPTLTTMERWPGVSVPIDDCGGKYHFDDVAADRACDFFSTFLTHAKGEFAGQPFILADWQRELVIRPLFGWQHPDGRRRYRKLYLEVPKKAGKSQVCAGLGLYLLFCDSEPSADIVVAAADVEQAGIVFNAARAMVEDSAELRGRCEIYRRSIVVEATRSSFKVISSDVAGSHGGNLHGLIIDELHAQPDRNLYDSLTKGVAARRQPLIALITTAGESLESICGEEHEYAVNLIKGTIVDETELPVIFAASPEDDWTSPDVWRRVNPNLGTTVKIDYLEAACLQAQHEPRRQNSFKRLHLNIWTQQHEVWIPLHEWDACTRAVSASAAPGAVVAAGLDLSSKLDLTALVVAVRFPDTSRPAEVLPLSGEPEDAAVPQRTLNVDFRVELHVYFWLPEEGLHERVKADRVPYDLWARQGFLRLTAGNVVDYNRIFDDIVREIGPQFRLQTGRIGYDPYNGGMLAGQLQARGFPVVEVPQTVRHLSEPAKLLEALVRSGRCAHAAHPVMRWNVGNVGVREDKNGNIFPFKPSKSKRIDGVAAAIIALNQLIAPPAVPVSIYATRRDADGQLVGIRSLADYL